MKVIDLFSGIGGFSLGLEAVGFQTVQFVEQDPFCQKVLKHHWPHVPIHADIKTFDGKRHKDIGLICGGFPCQGFSVAGKQRGVEDDRYLWPEMFRTIQDVEPSYVVGENVSGIINLALDKVYADLEKSYEVTIFNLPALAADALHRRERIFIIGVRKDLADSDNTRDRTPKLEVNRQQPQTVTQQSNKSQSQSSRLSETLADSDSDARGTRSGSKSLERESRLEHWGGSRGFTPKATNSHLADSGSIRFQRSAKKSVLGQPDLQRKLERGGSDKRIERTNECRVGHLAHGISRGLAGFEWPEEKLPRLATNEKNRGKKLKGLGNAVVPPLIAKIGALIMEYEMQIDHE
jgi:DNA (cytosine-5)-methyltransferase 1